jgi:hypothetical protein
MIWLEHAKPCFTEFACVSREFGPLEPASGPFRPADRALPRAGKNAEIFARKDRVVRLLSRWKRASRAAPADLLLLVRLGSQVSDRPATAPAQLGAERDSLHGGSPGEHVGEGSDIRGATRPNS